MLRRLCLLLFLLHLLPQLFAAPIGRTRELSLVITVKTTAGNHGGRVRDALDTWAAARGGGEGPEEEDTAKTTILFITDSLSATSAASLPPNLLVPSGCPSGHTNAALCCKMGAELRMALERRPDFWCHFDDDNFVLLANLRSVLGRFSPLADLYLGRPPTSFPISLQLASSSSSDSELARPFWFGTGGAGLCLSSSALGKMRNFVAGQQFERMCAKLGVPDDVTLGFILGNLLHIPLTPIGRFHSHLDRLDTIPRSELVKQVSLSGSRQSGNLVNVPELYPTDQDPLRFRSLQQFLRNGGRRRRKRR